MPRQHSLAGRICSAAALLTVLGAACTAAGTASEAAYHATESAPYRFQNTVISLHFDLRHKRIYGHETVIVLPKRRLKALPFNTKDIIYTKVAVNGTPVKYAVNTRRELITVGLEKAAQPRVPLRLDFTYWAQPERGIYFVIPDRAYPSITPEIWSQGEPTDNRRWFPTWDEPNEKTPSELILYVPHGWTAIANGTLSSHTRSGPDEIWHWVSRRPKSTYLIAFAAGPMVRYHSSLGSLSVDAFVRPADAALAPVCFSRTKDMVAFYEQLTGVRFPFSKYDQIATEHFIFGGMEDESATILSDLILHPQVQDVENSCDLVVSHELAQHWYGDDATMSDWSNLWLNEGFATYYDELWTGHRFGQAAFEYARYQAQQTYFAQARGRIRPLVDYVYGDPLTVFDSNSHERPAEVLHSLRWMVGDTRFFRAVHEYLRHYSYRNADTKNFFASIDKSLGMDLGWFENEWFFRAAYPRFFVSDTYDAARHALTLHVTQHNADGKPFRMPVAVDVYFSGRVVHSTPTVSRNAQTIIIPAVANAPAMVLFNADGNVLAQTTFKKSIHELAYQLAHAPYVGDREWALQNLAENAHAGRAVRLFSSAAIARAARSDPFWGIRADAMRPVAAFDNASAVSSGLRDRDVRVRLAAINAAAALSHSGSKAVVSGLRELTHDPDPNVAAAALTTLGALKVPGITNVLIASLHRPSFRQEIATGALRGLAANCTGSNYHAIARYTAYGVEVQERNAAIVALAQCAVSLHHSQTLLAPLTKIASHDPLISSRIAAVRALQLLGDAAALPALRRLSNEDPQEIVREIASGAAQTLSVQSQQRVRK